MSPSYAYTPFMWPLFISGVLSIWLSWGIWRRRNHILNKTFSVLLVVTAIWALGYMMSVLAAAPSTQMFWEQAKYVGIISIGPLWLAFALHYVQQGHLLRAWWLRALIVVELFALPAVFTNDQHRLWWPTTVFVVDGPYPSMAVTYGPLFWLHTAISYGFLLAGVLLYINFYRQVPVHHRRQTQIIIAAMFIPFLGDILVLSGGLPAPLSTLDLTPFLISVAGVLVSYALFQYRFLDIRPVARMVIVDQMQTGIIILDERWRLVDINPAAQRLTGLDLQWALGAPLVDAVTQGPLASVLREVLKQEKGALEVELGDGEQTHVVEISVSDLANERRPEQRRGHILALHDISDYKKAEHLTTQMMRMTAHDLRTPLSLAVGYLSLVMEEELPEATSANLEIVADALDRIKLLINNLLDLERVRSGVGMLVGDIDPVELVQQVHRDLQPLAAARRQNLGLKITGAPPPIRGDERLLQQALNNLVANSIQYTQEEGEIGLTVCAKPGELVFSVTDNGPGISAEAHARLFEPFFRAPETMHLQGGSGLGLSLVKAIVEAHGGQVWARSVLGRGSTFELSLPVGSGEMVGL